MINTVGKNPPDDTGLAGYLAAMPAGRYLGDAWRTEPLRIVTVDADAGDVPLLEMVSAAYPFIERDLAYTYVAVVPATVADLLTWYSGEDSYTACQYDVSAWADDPHEVAHLLAPLAHLGEDEVVLDELQSASLDAALCHLPATAVRQLAASLMSSIGLMDAAEAAVLALVEERAA